MKYYACLLLAVATAMADTTMMTPDKVMVLKKPESMTAEATTSSTMMMSNKEPVMMNEEAPSATEQDDTLRNPRSSKSPSLSEVAKRIYKDCVSKGSFDCMKPKMLSFLDAALRQDAVKITENLELVKNGRSPVPELDMSELESLPSESSSRAEALRYLMVEKLDAVLRSYDLNIRLPKELLSGEAASYVPSGFLESMPSEISVPLTDDQSASQERGFVKKVILPFLIGIKFKATTLIPLAIGLIALKTWKAITLGMLSLVISAAIVIFKLCKQKMVSYEVIHYPYYASPQSQEYPYTRSMRAFREYQ